MTQQDDKKKLIIFDSNAVIHRAYHALPPLTTKDGKLVNAVYGFLLVFLKAISDFSPDFMAAAFDLPAPTFRHKIYKEYKAKRPKAPADLYAQIPIIKEILGVFGVKIFEKEGFEADDLIGAIANLANKKGSPEEISVIIVTGDLDTLQLVDENTKIYFLRKGVKDTILYDKNSVADKFGGLLPDQMVDYKSLRGDPSDNIPGVKGIGDKTAIWLLSEFRTLEGIYEGIEKKSKKADNLAPKLKETLLKYKDQALLSKELVLLEKNVPINFNLKECKWGNYDKGRVASALSDLEFYSLVKRIKNGGFKKENLILGKTRENPAVEKQGKLL
ncbi:MAG: 5'-3' exonuclease H3TH domain-containing protein [Patescibacteria group bacterium]